MNEITKRLKKLVENRKTSVVVSKQSAYKPYSRSAKSGSFGGDGESSYSEEE